MKTKRFFNTVMTAFIAVIFSALTGCASTGATAGTATGGAATADTAAKLAADINAIQAGSAEVNGGMVTLTGDVRLETGLTVPAGVTLEVPEGVTLDLTAGGAALELQDGAVLTVNATGHGDHGKGWVEGSIRIGDSAAGINGSGTIYLKSKGCLLNIGGDRDRRRHLTLDGVTLVGLPDNSEPLVGVNNGGELVLKSGAITGNTRTGDEWVSGGGVGVWEGGLFTMEGGTIYGKADSLPAGTDAGLANSVRGYYISLCIDDESKAAKWGTGGTYTQGGVSQTGGSDINLRYTPNANGLGTDDMLIAVPGQ